MRYRHKGVVRVVQFVEELGRPYEPKTIKQTPSLDDYDRLVTYERDDEWHNRCTGQRRRKDRDRVNRYRPDY